MPTQDMLYTIEELSNLTGLHIRTIRYYIIKGLMPAREARGRYALYTDAHLQRLRLILKIKAAKLPLDMIKVKLNQVSDENIVSLLNDEMLADEKNSLFPPATENGESPAAYIARVLEHHKKLTALRSAPALVSSTEKAVRPAQTQDFQGEITQRLEVLPDIRLEFKFPLDAKTQERIEKILACVKKID